MPWTTFALLFLGPASTYLLARLAPHRAAPSAGLAWQRPSWSQKRGMS
jgi:hypothetical protein